MTRKQNSRVKILPGGVLDIEFKKGEDVNTVVKEVQEEFKALGVTGFKDKKLVELIKIVGKESGKKLKKGNKKKEKRVITNEH